MAAVVLAANEAVAYVGLHFIETLTRVLGILSDVDYSGRDAVVVALKGASVLSPDDAGITMKGLAHARGEQRLLQAIGVMDDEYVANNGDYPSIKALSKALEFRHAGKTFVPSVVHVFIAILLDIGGSFRVVHLRLVANALKLFGEEQEKNVRLVYVLLDVVSDADHVAHDAVIEALRQYEHYTTLLPRADATESDDALITGAQAMSAYQQLRFHATTPGGTVSGYVDGSDESDIFVNLRKVLVDANREESDGANSWVPPIVDWVRVVRESKARIRKSDLKLLAVATLQATEDEGRGQYAKTGGVFWFLNIVTDPTSPKHGAVWAALLADTNPVVSHDDIKNEEKK